MITHTKTQGYSLVEVLVSISVLLIAMVGPMTIAAQGIKTSRFALEQNTAFFLAQEGIEIIHKMRTDQALVEYDSLLSGSGTEQSWNWIGDIEGSVSSCSISSGGGCTFGIDYRDATLLSNLTSDECTGANVSQCILYKSTSAPSHSVYAHDSGGTQTPYTRTVTIEEVTSDAVKVTVKVTWESSVFSGTTQEVAVTTVLYDTTLNLP